MDQEKENMTKKNSDKKTDTEKDRDKQSKKEDLFDIKFLGTEIKNNNLKK